MGYETSWPSSYNYPDGINLGDPRAPWNQPNDYSHGEDEEEDEDEDI